MTPLQQIAMGLIIIVLMAPYGGIDLLYDPLGWLLVVTGVLRLRATAPGALPRTRLVIVLGVLAALSAVVLSLPRMADAPAPALALLATAQPLFCAALCAALADLASGTSAWSARFRWLSYAFVVVAGLPLIVLADVQEAFGVVAFAGAVTMLILIVVLFVLHRAPWLHRPTSDLAEPA